MVAALLAFAWLLGVAAAAFTGGGTAALVASAALSVLISFAAYPSRSTLFAAPVMATVVGVAFLLYGASAPDPDQGLTRLNNSGDVTLRGTVDDLPADWPTSRIYTVKVTGLNESGAWRHAEGMILVRTPTHTHFGPGDELQIKGDLKTPVSSGDFDYASYLLRRGITSIAAYPDVTYLGHTEPGGLEGHLAGVRAGIRDSLSDALPEPHASLAAGVLIGSDGIPPGLRDQMAATGTSHLVAVSGQNIAMLGALVAAAFAWLIGRRAASMLAIVSLAAYACVVGPDASVMRAAIMGALCFIATLTGRQHAAPLALVYAGAVMTALDPQIVHEVSFQLSFAATAGLVFLGPTLTRLVRRTLDVAPLPEISRQPLAETMGITLAAIAATLPVTAITFETVSIVAPIANLFAVPAFAAVAISSAIAAMIVTIVPELTILATWVAYFPVAYMLATVRSFASLPMASIDTGGVTFLHALIWYTAIAAFLRWSGRQGEITTPARHGPLPMRKTAALVGLAVTAALAAAALWLPASAPGDGRVSVTALDVGQGDAILIEDASGRRILVDGGPRGDDLALALGRHLPFDDRRIDVVILTHAQADHVSGLLEVLETHNVDRIVANPVDPGAPLTDEWINKLSSLGIPVEEPFPGQVIHMDGADLHVLQATSTAPDLNDQSVVLRLVSGQSSFLLTGDLGEDGERALLRTGKAIDADVLKVGHHGSRFSTSDDFIARVSPEVSLISSGAGNPYGHPAQELLDRIADSAIYRTDEQGDVTVSTDGERLWVTTQR
jgi:competence protein ComEC